MRIPITFVFLVLAYWTLTGLQMGRFADDPGLGWHLLTGDFILTNHAIPRLDPFLDYPTPRPWIADQWLSDVLLVGALRVGGPEFGMPLLYAALTGIFLLTFMGITFFAASTHSGSPLLGGIAAFIALKLSSIHFIIRPVILGFFLFAVVIWIVWGVVRKVRSGTAVTIRELVILVPLTLVWANIHPSFGLGIIVVGLATVGLLYDTVILERRPLDTHLFTLLGSVAVLMCLASLCNPYGTDLVRQVFGLVGDDFFMSLNQEWQSIDPRSGEGQLFFMTLAILGLGAFASPRGRPPQYFTEILVLGFLAFSTLKSVRFLPYFAIAAAPLLAQALRHLLSFEPLMRLAPYHRLSQLCTILDRREEQTRLGYTTSITIVMCLLLIGAYRFGVVYPYRGPFGPSTDRFPFDGVAKLAEILGPKPLSTPIPIAASPDWGGFLARWGGGYVRPIIDDRNSLLGAAAYKDYLSSTAIGGDITGYLNRRGARFLLVKTNEPLAIYLRDTGKLQERWRGAVSSLFELPT